MEDNLNKEWDRADRLFEAITKGIAWFTIEEELIIKSHLARLWHDHPEMTERIYTNNKQQSLTREGKA